MPDADVVVFQLTDEYEDFSGGSVSLHEGELYDVGEALEDGDGRIVLDPAPRVTEDEEVPEAEAQRSLRDAAILGALEKYPALEKVEATSGDTPPSYEDVDMTIASGATLSELRDRASELDIAGRSSMNKEQLAEAIAAKEAELASGEETDEGGDAETEGEE